MVDTGPIIPIWAAAGAPMRAIAIMTPNTGNTVQATPFSADSQYTGAGTTSAPSGRVRKNCRRQNAQATQLA